MGAGTLSAARRAWGYAAAVVAPVLAVPILVPLRDSLNLASDVAVYLVLVVLTALLGGLGPALVAACLGAVLLNFFFTPAVPHVRHRGREQCCGAGGLRLGRRPRELGRRRG